MRNWYQVWSQFILQINVNDKINPNALLCKNNVKHHSSAEKYEDVMDVIPSGNTNRFLQKQITIWGYRLIFLSQYHPSTPKIDEIDIIHKIELWFFSFFVQVDLDVLYEDLLQKLKV